MRVVEAPPIQFRCDSCGALNEGTPDEFIEQHTMPPSWRAKCAFCGVTCRCFPSPLIARTVGSMSSSDVIRTFVERSADQTRRVMQPFLLGRGYGGPGGGRS